MTKKSRKRPVPKVNSKERHLRRAARRPDGQRTKPYAFRLPPDVVAMADAAADAADVSRNNIVEHALRTMFAKYGNAKQERSRDQFDLFT